MYVWGMHGYWWFFWIFLWILFFSFMMPVRRTTYRQMQLAFPVSEYNAIFGEPVWDDISPNALAGGGTGGG